MSSGQVAFLTSIGDVVSAEHFPEPVSRLQKAHKVGFALRHFLGDDTGDLRCLDVGSSIGVMSAHLSKRLGQVLGIEPSVSAVQAAMNAWSKPNLFFAVGDGLHLPLADESVDIVICAQIYEHVPHAGTLMAEIWRVLVPNGVCFFSGPNRLWPIEPHYFLPFLHWLPECLSNIYVQLTRRDKLFRIHSLTYWTLRNLMRNTGFEVHDLTVAMLRAPAQYGCDDFRGRALFSRIPWAVLRKLVFILPNFNWILVKKLSIAQDGHENRN